MLKQVELILEQMPDNGLVELVLVDNNSTDDSFSKASSLAREHNHFRVYQNFANLGLGGNLLRVIEQARGEWIWLLGDDDPVESNALELVLFVLSKRSESDVFVKFIQEQDQSCFPSRDLIRTPGEFASVFADAYRFGVLLFISTCLIRSDFARQHMNSAYHWNYSMGPHLVFALMSAKEGLGLCLCRGNIVTWGNPTGGATWNRWRLQMGLLTLGELEGLEELYLTLFPKIVGKWMGERPWLSIPAILFNSADRDVSYWKAYLLRMAAGAPLKLGLWIYLWSIIASLKPLRSLFKNLIRKIKKGRRDTLGIDRS